MKLCLVKSASFVLSLVVLSAGFGCSGTDTARVSSDKPAATSKGGDTGDGSDDVVVADTVSIVHGVPDRGRDPAVVVIDVGGEGLCSGSLIARNAVLTARHCVARTTEKVACPPSKKQVLGEREPSTLRIYAGEDVERARFVAAGSRVVAPAGSFLCDADVAVIMLDREVRGIDPLPIKSSGVAQGDYVRAVGFGEQAAGGPAGVKMLREHVRVLGTSPHEFLVGESTCRGDSGGPAIDEETGAIVGVVSRGAAECDGPNAHNIYTRTDAFYDLIDGAIEGVSPPAPASPPAPGEPAADAGADGGKKKSSSDAGTTTKKPPAKKPVPDMGGACETGDDCAAGVCVEDGTLRYCSRACGKGDRCPAHFRCTAAQGGGSVCVQQ